MLILLYLYEQNEFGFSDWIWIKKVKNENFVMVRFLRQKNRGLYHVIPVLLSVTMWPKIASKIGPKLACAAGGIVSVRD